MNKPQVEGKIWDRKWKEIDILHFKDNAFIFDLWTRFHFPLVEKYLSKLSKGSLFLEAGCGMGQWCFYAAEKYKVKALGVDIAAENINRLKHLCFQENQEVEFRFDDLVNSGLESNLCEMFVSLGVIEHSPDFSLMVKNLYRVLKPGGIGIITVPNYYAVHTFTRPLLQLCQKWDIGYERSFSLHGLRRLVLNAGFKIIESGILPTGELFGSFLNNLPLFGGSIRRMGLHIESKQSIFGFIVFVVVEKNGLHNA